MPSGNVGHAGVRRTRKDDLEGGSACLTAKGMWFPSFNRGWAQNPEKARLRARACGKHKSPFGEFE